MRADVFCNNNPIGTIDWTPDACGVQVNLDCAVCGDELLRCYAVVNGNILRVGLPAPEPLPQSNAPPEPPLVTGDTVLDALLSNENVQIQPTETGLRLQCPFDPKKPFALAPAFVLCRTEGNTAVLEWKKDAADAAASSEKA